MPRIKFNDGQEIIFEDLNAIAAAIEKELYDRIAYEMGARQTDYVFSDGFLVTRTNSTTVSVAAGIGFQTDGTQTDPEPTKRLLYLGSAASKSITTPDATNPRIDIVSIKAARATIDTDSRNFKDVDDSISVETFDVETDWEADVVVTAGTPAGSPAVPSTPAGYIKIAELAVSASTGIAASGAITDKRNVFLPGSSKKAYVSKSAAYTATPMDELILCDASGGAFSVTLPPAAICPGKVISICNIGSSGTVTADGNASELISGELTQAIPNQYTVLHMLSISTGWILL